MKEHARSVAMVTGGAQGLGEAISASLVRQGLDVVIADVRGDKAESVARGLRDTLIKAENAHVQVDALQLDVTDAVECKKAINEVVDKYGRLDVLINNAGVDETVSIEEMSPESWDRIMATNLRGPFLLSKYALSQMTRIGEGYIINIASTASKRAWPNASAYHASKWGVLGFTHALHTEARPHGVKVTAVVCGGMRTPFLTERFPDIDLATLQDPRNVAHTISYLLTVPKETVIPEIMVLPMRESSWP